MKSHCPLLSPRHGCRPRGRWADVAEAFPGDLHVVVEKKKTMMATTHLGLRGIGPGLDRLQQKAHDG